MKSIITYVFLITLFALQPIEIQARQWQASLDFNIGAPQGEFNDQLDRLGVGLNFTGGYQFRESPFMIGLDLGFMNFGTDSREEPLSSNIPDLTVRVDNSYNLATGNIVMRAISPESAVRPFLEGLFGFNYFYTETSIRERGFGSDEPVLRDTNFDDFTLNYGVGGGAFFRIWQNRREKMDPYSIEASSIYISLASRYMFGNEAEYLKEGSITRENGQVTYDVSRSRTDLLYFKLGIGLNF